MALKSRTIEKILKFGNKTKNTASGAIEPRT
jgi:hypothetical protein